MLRSATQRTHGAFTENTGKLKAEDVEVVLESLVEAGNGEWTEQAKHKHANANANANANRTLRLLWRSYVEWGQMIFAWAQKRGTAVCTLFEIREGPDSEGQGSLAVRRALCAVCCLLCGEFAEFHMLDRDVLISSLRVLERDGRATMFAAGDEDSLGVKFALH